MSRQENEPEESRLSTPNSGTSANEREGEGHQDGLQHEGSRQLVVADEGGAVLRDHATNPDRGSDDQPSLKAESGCIISAQYIIFFYQEYKSSRLQSKERNVSSPSTSQHSQRS